MSISNVGASNLSAMQSVRASGANRPPRPEGGREGMETKLNSALESQGFSDTQLSELREKIETAMSSARESGADPEAMKSTIDNVLQESGVDLEKFQESMGTPPAQNGAEGTSSSGKFDSFLQSRGIDPTQFKTALMSSMDNGTDLSKAFAGAGVGSDVDVFA